MFTVSISLSLRQKTSFSPRKPILLFLNNRCSSFSIRSVSEDLCTHNTFGLSNVHCLIPRNLCSIPARVHPILQMVPLQSDIPDDTRYTMLILAAPCFFLVQISLHMMGRLQEPLLFGFPKHTHI